MSIITSKAFDLSYIILLLSNIFFCLWFILQHTAMLYEIKCVKKINTQVL